MIDRERGEHRPERGAAPTNVFVSHIHEEAALALVLKKWIADTLLGEVTVFVSSDKESDNPAGARWWEDSIEPALISASSLISLCSPRSINRFWIACELGIAVGCQCKSIIPVCHSGLAPSALPKLLSDRAAVSAESPSLWDELFAALTKRLGYTRTPPPNPDFYSAITAALAKCQRGSADPPNGAAAEGAAPLPDQCIVIMRMIVKASDLVAQLTSQDIAKAARWNVEMTRHYLELLSAQHMVTSTFSSRGTHYHLTALGRSFLVNKGLLGPDTR